MKRFSSLLLLLALSGPARADDPPSDERLRELVRQLDADDAGARQTAAEELEKAGEAAIPFLKDAVDKGSPETSLAAQRIVRTISLHAVLARPECRVLQSVWDKLLAEGRFDSLRALEAPGAVSAGTVDALLDLLRLEPEGEAGAIARSVLLPILAPRAFRWMGSFTGIGGGAGADTAEGFFREVLGDACRISEAAVKRMAGLKAPEFGVSFGSVVGTSLDDAALEVCRDAKLSFRVDEPSWQFFIEEPAESVAGWEKMWKDIRGDRSALIDLGLADLPDGSKLAAPDLDPWIAELSSADLRHSRTARRVLREIPDALIPEVSARAAKDGAVPALKDLDELLQLRHRARIAFLSTFGGRSRLFLMNLDGSGAHRVKTGLTRAESIVGTMGGGKTLVLWGARPKDKWGHFRLDLSGPGGAKRMRFPEGNRTPSPDWRFVAGWTQSNQLQLTNRTSGKTTTLQKKWEMAPVVWSPKSDALAWQSGKKLRVHSLASRKTRTYDDTPVFYNEFAWRPDGAALAIAEAPDAWDTFPHEDAVSRIVVLDLATGKKTTLAEERIAPTGLSWSRDGKRLAWSGTDFSNEETPGLTEYFDFSNGKVRVVPDPAPVPGYPHSSCEWSDDGRYLFVYQMRRRLSVLVHDTQTGLTREIRGPESSSLSWVPGLDVLLESDAGAISLRTPDGRTLPLTEGLASASDPCPLGEERR